MHYFFIIIIVTILVSALYFSKSLDEKDSSETKKEKRKKKIEDEIFQSLKDEIKDASTTEAKEKIERAVRDQGYLEEDWQIDSAVKRIKDKLERNNKKVGRDSKEESTTKTSTCLFYGSDWKEAGFTIISSPQYFDILVTDNKVYVIKIPKTQWRLGAHLWFLSRPFRSTFRSFYWAHD